MNTPAIKKLRRRLADDEPVYGLWVTLDSASITEIGVALGLDWIVIDAEHGHLDFKEIVEHLRAAARSETVVLVRIAELSVGVIKRVLDIGADGVVVPWIESADQLRQAVSYARYPPKGKRGIGAERATGWGACIAEHVREANDHVLVVPMLETVSAGRRIEELCQIPGVDLFFFGPADYSSTAGYTGQWENPDVAEQLRAIKDTIRSCGKHCGIVATGNDNLVERRQQGFRMLGLGLDAGLLIRSVTEALSRVGREATITPTLVPRSPEAGRASDAPERIEGISRPEATEGIELASDVAFQPMVGAHNEARSLCTGLVTVAPRSRLGYYIHPCEEAITLLAGEAAVDVEGRRYPLRPLDSLYVPAKVVHRVENLSNERKAVVHVAMAGDSPGDMFTPHAFAPASVPHRPTGGDHAEHLTRHATAEPYELAPGTKFHDLFNAKLGSRRICGGYGIFEPGARLPCHLHEYDESITIVQGTAICVVEGREYELSGYATAMVPQGRCHYFVNRSTEPMAMIWVYAGEMPERRVVEDRYCHPDGDADRQAR